MRIELHCAGCFCRFLAPAGGAGFQTAPLEDDNHVGMFNDEPWYDLGDGNTFEDMIFATLMEKGATCCPDCGDPVSISEEHLGQLAMAMLADF